MSDNNDAVRDKDKSATSIPLLFDAFDAGQVIAAKLIPKYHPGIASANISYICRNKASKRGGLPVPGNIYKISGKFRFLTGADFVLEVALEIWNDLGPTQRTALIDHLLSRCIGEEDEETGDMKYRIIPPEVQEFPEVVERHGQWHEGLVRMKRSLKGAA